LVGLEDTPFQPTTNDIFQPDNLLLKNAATRVTFFIKDTVIYDQFFTRYLFD
jgi:hypothetical protein